MVTLTATAVALSTAVKVLLWPAYHSTDMEVHRNWLAITYSLPLRKWYEDATSIWTLDYPPFFAYLSWLLAQPAALVDARIVDLRGGLEYAAWSCKAYMRLSVLVTELVLAAALAAHRRCEEPGSASTILLVSVLTHPALLIVDHIHFQYNGFLFGVLLVALYAARVRHPLACAFSFASLLCFKHIFMYVAPAFAVYLFRVYLVPQRDSLAAALRQLPQRTVSLGSATLTPFVLSTMPFAFDAWNAGQPALGVWQQMFARLFPFHRGLIHAYWAPNVWALYAALDRVLVRLGPAEARGASMTRGIVGDTTFGVLPDVRPGACFAVTLGVMLVYLARLWLRPTYRSLVACVALCAMASFQLGWHVHEKAVLLVLVPLSLVGAQSYAMLRTLLLLSATGIVSLVPLLIQPLEVPIALLYAAVWFTVVRQALVRRVTRPMPSNAGAIMHWLESVYMAGLVVVVLGTQIVWPLLLSAFPHLNVPQLEFAPLMATSLYCALGTVWGWMRLSYIYLVEGVEDADVHTKAE